MNIDKLLEDIARREGWPTYTNRKADKGGPTKGGITLDALSAYLGRPATIEELQRLTWDLARRIYRRRYIEPWEWVLPNQRLFELLLDYAITSWHDDPTIALQRGTGVKVDGILGPKTKAAVLAADQEALYKYVWRHRMGKFFEVAYDPAVRELLRTNEATQLHNLRGWMNRLAEFL